MAGVGGRGGSEYTGRCRNGLTAPWKPPCEENGGATAVAQKRIVCSQK